MAQRTGAQLKSTDMAAADSALDTALGTPTEANIQAAITAFTTVETNGRDSFAIQTPTASAPTAYAGQPHTHGAAIAQRPGVDIAVLARAARRDLQLILQKQRNLPGSTAGNADLVKALNRLKRNLNGGLWGRLRDKPTTD